MFDTKNETRLYWSDASVLALAELPLVQMHFVPRLDRPWSSLADAGTIATAVALANAVLDAVGEHSGNGMLDPDSVKAII